MPYKRDVIQYFFYFATFSMKKNNLKFKTVKVEGFHARSRLRSAATPQYPSKLKKYLFFFNFALGRNRTRDPRVPEPKRTPLGYILPYYYITPFPITIRKTVS
jgi:hypothetical protein